MKPKTLNALLRVYDQLDEIVIHLNNLADQAVLEGDYDDGSLLQSRADILFVQMINIDIVVSEHEG